MGADDDTQEAPMGINYATSYSRTFCTECGAATSNNLMTCMACANAADASDDWCRTCENINEYCICDKTAQEVPMTNCSTDLIYAQTIDGHRVEVLDATHARVDGIAASLTSEQANNPDVGAVARQLIAQTREAPMTTNATTRETPEQISRQYPGAYLVTLHHEDGRRCFYAVERTAEQARTERRRLLALGWFAVSIIRDGLDITPGHHMPEKEVTQDMPSDAPHAPVSDDSAANEAEPVTRCIHCHNTLLGLEQLGDTCAACAEFEDWAERQEGKHEVQDVCDAWNAHQAKYAESDVPAKDDLGAIDVQIARLRFEREEVRGAIQESYGVEDAAFMAALYAEREHLSAQIQALNAARFMHAAQDVMDNALDFGRYS
jgi:hypothetical protein